MPQIQICPDPIFLRKFALGLSSAAESEALAGHLDHCPACLDVLGRLQPDDALLRALREAPKDDDQMLAHVEEQVVGRLAALGLGMASWGAATLPPSVTPGAPAVGRTVGGITEEDYSFLAPAVGPDEMGCLGSFYVQRVLGVGGMGVVFLARDTKLNRQVAVKALRPALAASASARQRFLREAQAAAALNHDNVVPIYHVGEEGGFPFLVMPFLQGATMEELLTSEGKFAPLRAIRIGRQVALGLEAAHRRGLIHRDIKPGNVWLEADPETSASSDRVKLLDFGLAQAVGTAGHLTQSGLILGTPQYMAPEQAQGGTVDTRCDLFSLGSVLYHMVVGEPPFPGSDTMSVLVGLAVDTPVPPSARNPAVPAALSDLIMRLLEKDRTKRPGSAREVADQLDAVEHGLARGAAETIAPPPSVPAQQTQPEEHLARPRRRLLVATLGLFAAAALVVGGVVLIVRGQRVEVPDGSEVVVDDKGHPDKFTGVYGPPTRRERGGGG